MKKLFILSTVWVEPKSSGAGTRMLSLINFFLKEGYVITYGSTSKASEFKAELVGVSEIVIELNNSSFDIVLEAVNPDIVLYDRFMVEEQFGWRVREVCPQALTILDTEDLHSLRKSRHLALKQNVEFTVDFWKKQEITLREMASIYRTDLSLIISEVERDFLINSFSIPAQLLCYLPLLIECKLDLNTVEKQHFVTIGNFLHEPNWDSVRYLKEEVWPLIRKRLPKAELHVYGAYSSPKVQQLHNAKAGFIIKGRAEDAVKVLSDARICLAPLRFGAGLKTKFLEAMSCGTPSVTTKVGAEGINGDLPWSGTIAETPMDIATGAIRLYSKSELYIKAQQNGYDVLSQRFDKTEHLINLKDQLNYQLENLEELRLLNFTGQMFKHQTMNSTKFFSKWIEAKNI